MGKLRVYCLKALNKLSIYPLSNTPSVPSDSQLQGGVGFFFTHVVTDDPMLEHSALVKIQMMAHQLAMCHPTDGVDEVATVEIFKPVLVQVMGIGTTIKVMCRRVFDSILIASVLWEWLEHVEQ